MRKFLCWLGWHSLVRNGLKQDSFSSYGVLALWSCSRCPQKKALFGSDLFRTNCDETLWKKSVLEE